MVASHTPLHETPERGRTLPSRNGDKPTAQASPEGSGPSPGGLKLHETYLCYFSPPMGPEGLAASNLPTRSDMYASYVDTSDLYRLLDAARMWQRHD